MDTNKLYSELTGNDIYEQHATAFKSVSAYVITNKKGERVATIAFKHGGAVTCYFHVLGNPMVKASAGGGGYDRTSAAARKAARKVKIREQYDREPAADYAKQCREFRAIIDAVQDGGRSWDGDFRAVGFNVLQAV